MRVGLSFEPQPIIEDYKVYTITGHYETDIEVVRGDPYMEGLIQEAHGRKSSSAVTSPM